MIESLVNIGNKITNVDETVNVIKDNLDDAFKNDMYMKDVSIDLTDFKDFNSEMHNSIDQYNLIESSYFKEKFNKQIIPQNNDDAYSIKPKVTPIHS